MPKLHLTSIRIDPEGRLLVVPDLPPDRNLAHIYRAARGVRWDEAERERCTPAPETITYFDRFRHIDEATADEYGALLVVSKRTRFTHVPDSVEQEIRAWQPSPKLEKRCRRLRARSRTCALTPVHTSRTSPFDSDVLGTLASSAFDGRRQIG